MATTKSKPVYVNVPGSVILHHADGTHEQYHYGDRVDPSLLADYQLEMLDKFTDGEKRFSGEDIERQQAREAHARAALADNGQPFSTSSPIPGNYAELEEDEAALFVSRLADFPNAQADVLFHEILRGGNRRLVVDSGSEYAQQEAERRISELSNDERDYAEEPGDTSGPQVGTLGDPAVVDVAAAALEHQSVPAPSGSDD